MSQTTKDKIFNADLTALKEADLTVALMTGQDIDSGTAAEIGFTYANGKPIIAITAYERRFRNLFVDGMISKTVNDVDELLSAISSINPKH
jgi:nucleoside 2-deoxyribosyltransferase